MPPLRERPEDIEALSRHFLASFQKSNLNAPRNFSLEAIEVLLSYRWPGNVRELQNAVERSVIIGRGKETITPADLGLPGRIKKADDYRGKTLKESINLFKKNFVREVLNANGGNQTLSAEALGIQRTYLSRMIKELNIAGDTE